MSLVGAILLVVLLVVTDSPLLQPSVAGLNPILTRMILGSRTDPNTDRMFQVFLIAFVACLTICTIVN